MLPVKDSLPILPSLLDSRWLAVTIEAPLAGSMASGLRGESATTQFWYPMLYGPCQHSRCTPSKLAMKFPGEHLGLQKDETTAFSTSHARINQLTMSSINPPMADGTLPKRNA